MKKFSSWLVTHSLNGPLHVRSTMEREIDVATFAPNADGVELKHRSPAGLGEAAARADRGADPPTCAPPHSTHPPTYRWEPDGAVDLWRTTVSPHSL